MCGMVKMRRNITVLPEFHSSVFSDKASPPMYRLSRLISTNRTLIYGLASWKFTSRTQARESTWRIWWSLRRPPVLFQEHHLWNSKRTLKLACLSVGSSSNALQRRFDQSLWTSLSMSSKKRRRWRPCWSRLEQSLITRIKNHRSWLLTLSWPASVSESLEWRSSPRLWDSKPTRLMSESSIIQMPTIGKKSKP